MKILVLDDHPAIQKFVKKAILSILPNAKISLCSNIDSARQILNEKPRINFVICDLELNFGCSTLIPELCNDRKIPCMIYSSHVNMVLIQELKNQLNTNNELMYELEERGILCENLEIELDDISHINE